MAARTGTLYGRKATAGHIYTIAGDGTFGFSGDGGPATEAGIEPGAMAADSAGNVVVADASGPRIRVVAAVSGTFYGQQMSAGDIYTIAGDGISGYSGDGGLATAATLESPVALAIDSASNVLISDQGSSVIRIVAARSGRFLGHRLTAGNIYTIAGNVSSTSLGDGGPATRAALQSPDGIAVSRAGNLLIADTGHGRVRSVSG